MEHKTGQQPTSHFRHSLEGAAPVAPEANDFQATGSKDSRSKSSNWAEVVGKKSSGLKRSGSIISGQSTEHLDRLTTIHNLEILKGIPLCLAMGTFGKLFGVGGDPLENMAMSKRVVKLQDFISHNWVIPRFTKWGVLVLHYNVKPACVATLAVCLFVSLLMLQGLLPLSILGAKGFEVEKNTGSVNRADMNPFVGCLTFYVVLVFWQDIKRRLPSSLQVRERMTFVDKSCIHQTDIAKMIEGISNLAGFLRSSEYMVVCCGPQYFRKLWTVYEIASFLSIHRDPSRIKIYPSAWAKQLSILAVCVTISFLLRTAVSRVAQELTGHKDRGIETMFWIAEGFAMVVAYTYCLRHSVMINEQIKKDLSAFDIRNAHCAVESDRPIVEANVSTFMRELGRVPEHAQQEEALDAFNHMVHTDFLSYIADARTEIRFQLLFQIAVMLPQLLERVDMLVERVLFGDPIMVITWVVGLSEYTYTVVLLGNLVALPLITRSLKLTSWRKHFLIFATSFLIVVAMLIYKFGLRDPIALPALDMRLEDGARWQAMVMITLFHACCIGLTVWTSRRPCCRRRHEVLLAEIRPGINVSV